MGIGQKVQNKIRKFLYGDAGNFHDAVQDGISKGYKKANSIRVSKGLPPVPPPGKSKQ